MAGLNISLPESVAAFVKEEAAKRGYRTPRDYVVAVLREAQVRDLASPDKSPGSLSDRDRDARREQLRADIGLALHQIQDGRSRTYDEPALQELARGIRARGRARLRRGHSGSP